MKKWEEVKKEINFTQEEIEEMELEKELIRTTIEIRKKSNLTQQQLSELSGIIQPSIAKIENFVRTPQYTTLMKLLYSMGYTLKVVPLEKKSDWHILNIYYIIIQNLKNITIFFSMP